MNPLIIALTAVAGLGAGISAHKSKRKNNMSQTYLLRLVQCLKDGKEPSDRLLECAMYEALKKGRPDIAEMIHDRFYETEDETEDEQESDESGSEPNTKEDTLTVSGKSSPIAGVSNESWADFVTRLETEKVDYNTSRYVGKYHLRKDRLQELGFSFENPPDDETQYAMLVADLVDAKERAEQLFVDYLTNVVIIDGKEHPVTTSGLLGLLKAAGARHARSWLINEEDRKKYPGTTAVFLATNGVF